MRASKVVFSRTLDSVKGNARLAEGSVAEEIAAALAATDNDVEIGGAGLAASAMELGLVDELRMFRNPIVVGGGTPFLPTVTEDVPLELIETRTFGSSVIYERHRRISDDRTDPPDGGLRGVTAGVSPSTGRRPTVIRGRTRAGAFLPVSVFPRTRRATRGRTH